ncbi:MAG: prepilin-type N-terminal cleavage/methylation domain-containing protein [Phycisphaerae bacterium]
MPGLTPSTTLRPCQSETDRRPRTPRGMSLVELIVALLILSLISTAVCTLTFGAFNTDRFLRVRNTALAEIELAAARMTNNIREAQTGSIVVGTGTLTTMTQADTAHGFPNGVTVSYSLRADPVNTGMSQIIENDPRYGATNVLANNVSTFTVATVAGITGLYQVDIVINSKPIEERHLKIFCRN